MISLKKAMFSGEKQRAGGKKLDRIFIRGDNKPQYNVPVAQLDRVLASEARGFGFDSRRG